jgi:hypothetical protein
MTMQYTLIFFSLPVFRQGSKCLHRCGREDMAAQWVRLKEDLVAWVGPDPQHWCLGSQAHCHPRCHGVRGEHPRCSFDMEQARVESKHWQDITSTEHWLLSPFVLPHLVPTLMPAQQGLVSVFAVGEVKRLAQSPNGQITTHVFLSHSPRYLKDIALPLCSWGFGRVSPCLCPFLPLMPLKQGHFHGWRTWASTQRQVLRWSHGGLSALLFQNSS